MNTTYLNSLEACKEAQEFCASFNSYQEAWECDD